MPAASRGSSSRESTLAADVMRRADGILLAGGGDVEPLAFRRNAASDVRCRRIGPRRLRNRADSAGDERDLPLLAICRGIQVLNVARGGTLVQDIPTELPGTLEHKLAVPPHNAFDLAHEIWIEKDRCCHASPATARSRATRAT